MSWIILAMFPPLMWATSNFIDKYLLTKYFKESGTGTILLFTSLVGTFLMPIIYFFDPSVVQIDFRNTILIIFNGVLFVFAYFPYMKVLNEEDASSVGSLFQMIPVFAYFLAYFLLGEKLTSQQIFASILIILGGFVMMLESKGFPKLKTKAFLLMMMTSMIFAVQSVVLKFVVIRENIWTTTFWQYAGFTLSAIFLFSIKQYRDEFRSVIKKNKPTFIGVNILNELINLTGEIFLTFALVVAPVALVWIINGLMPVFLFFIGIFLTLIFPKIFNENLQKRHLAQKVIAIIIMLMGASLLK